MSTDASLTVDIAQLPRDVDTLQALVVQLVAALQQSQARITQLEHHMDLLVRKVYGRSSEKLDPRQLALFEKEADEPPPLLHGHLRVAEPSGGDPGRHEVLVRGQGGMRGRGQAALHRDRMGRRVPRS